jgi:hypothetical protein
LKVEVLPDFYIEISPKINDFCKKMFFFKSKLKSSQPDRHNTISALMPEAELGSFYQCLS